jgi:HK97 family phage major capsid protein
VEVDELSGKDLIEKSIAIEYVEEKEQVKGEIKMDIKEVKKEEFAIGKTLQYIAKASGMSEGVSADGGAALYTGVTELMGIATDSAILYPRCNKITLPASSNAIKVLIDASDPWVAANAPVICRPTEGGVKSEAVLSFASEVVEVKKEVLYIPCTDELLEDVPSLEGFVTGYSKGKMGLRMDDLLLNGNPSTTGCKGVTDSNVSGYVVTVSVAATPTVTDLVEMEQAIAKQFDDAEWYVNRNVWALIAGAHANYNNIGYQVVDLQNKTILGRKVNIMHTLAASSLLLGSPRAITVVEPRINDVAAKSVDVLFKTDETVFRLVKRIGSCLNFKKRQATDGTYVAGWAKASFGS